MRPDRRPLAVQLVVKGVFPLDEIQIFPLSFQNHSGPEGFIEQVVEHFGYALCDGRRVAVAIRVLALSRLFLETTDGNAYILAHQRADVLELLVDDPEVDLLRRTRFMLAVDGRGASAQCKRQHQNEDRTRGNASSFHVFTLIPKSIFGH